LTEYIPLLPEVGVGNLLSAVEHAHRKLKGTDFRVSLRVLEQESIGCVVTDPPWSYGEEEKGGKNRNQRLLAYPTISEEDMVVLFKLLFRCLRQDRNVWIWSDWKNVPLVIRTGEQSGLKYFALLTAKRARLGLGFHVRKNCYYVVGLAKGKPQVRANLHEFLGEWDLVGSGKPWEATVMLLRHSLPPKEQWIDPFPATHTEVPKELREGQAVNLERLFQKGFHRVTSKGRSRPKQFHEMDEE